MLLGSLLCLSSIDVFSQNDILSNSRFSAVLLRDSLVLNPNEYIFNSLTLINHSSEILDLGLRIELPKGFSLLSPLASYTRIGPGQTNGIPIRIRADQNVLGGKSYIIKVTIEDPITGDKIPRIIIAELNLKTDWRASLVNPVSYTSDKESLPDFKILLANNGNRTELFDFSLESEIRLSLPSKGNQVLLRPGQDTLINVSVRSRNLEQINAEVKVIIQARNGQKILYQKLYIVSSEYKAHSFNRYYAPIEIGWQRVNLAKGVSASQLFSAFGNLQLDNKKDISIRTQINLIDGEYDKFNSYFLGRLSTRFAEYEVGNIDDFMYSQINGIGSRVTFRKNNQSYQAFALKSQFHEGNISGLRQHLILSDQSKIETEALFKQNKETGLSSFFAAHSYNLNFSTNGKFTVKAGYSIEKANSIGNLEKGSLAGYSFYLSNNRAVIYSNVQYFSKWFPGLNRGMFTQNHDFKVNVGLLKIGGYGTYLNRSPQVYSLDYSESYQASSNKSSSYGFQIGVKLGNNSLLFKGGNTYQYQGSSFYLNNSEGFVNPVIKGTKLSLNYYFSNSRANHYVSLNAINSKVDKEVVSDGHIESYNIQMNGRMKSFSYSMRYDIGPSYYFDYLYLYRTGISSSRKQMSIFWHAKDKKMLQNRLSLNYIDMSAFSTKSLMLRNNIDIHNSEKGWRFGLNSSVNLLKIKAVPFISFSVSKVLNMPVPFLKRYNNLWIFRVKMGHLFRVKVSQ
jgi:hypothetical protein